MVKTDGAGSERLAADLLADERPALWSRAIVLWHLLSLDAPTVAVTWTWAIAAANHIQLPGVALLAMGVAVWMLYAADRLLDGRGLGAAGDARPGEIEARHQFHYRHRRWFRLGIVLASLALSVMLPRLPAEAMRLYLVLGGLLAGYFVLIHATPTDGGRPVLRLPKEIAVGVFFAAAVFIPTVAREPLLRLRLLPEAVLLGALCSLNCLYIFRWEHYGEHVGEHAGEHSPTVHWATRLALRALSWLTAEVVAAGVALAVWGSAGWVAPVACAVAGGLLRVLDVARARWVERTVLRAAADVCLLTPLLLVPWLLVR